MLVFSANSDSNEGNMSLDEATSGTARLEDPWAILMGSWSMVEAGGSPEVVVPFGICDERFDSSTMLLPSPAV